MIAFPSLRMAGVLYLSGPGGEGGKPRWLLEDLRMLETNAIVERIKELGGRLEALRGYL
jgi:hypothetical protein